MLKTIPKAQTPVADGKLACGHPDGGGEGCEGFSGDSGVGEPDSEPPAIHSDGGKALPEEGKELPEAGKAQPEGGKVLPEETKAPPDIKGDANHVEDVGVREKDVSDRGNGEAGAAEALSWKEKTLSQEGSTAESGPQKTVEEDKQGRPDALSPPCPAAASDQEATAMTDSSEGGGAPSRDSGISHMNVASTSELEDESARRRSLMIDTCTQTDHDHGGQAEWEKTVGRTVESSSDKDESTRGSDLGLSAMCVCTDDNDNKEEGKTQCDVCGLYSSARQETSNSLCARPGETSNSVPQNRQSRCTSDYSSISSSDSPRASDSSNRTCDSSNSPGSSTGSSGKGGSSNRRSGHRKVVTSGELSPIASCGGESAVNVGLSVNTGLTPEDTSKDMGSRSPCTPTSGCLKGATRNTSGAHVQFETPCDEDGHMLQDTYVTSDGHVELQRANGGSGGSGTPTHADPLARLWSKLIPDSSPSDAASSFTVPKKWRRRHISSSSSISLGSSSSASSSDGSTEFERRAPDGGWGWIVVAASFMVHCIADGVTMSFGVLFVELLNYFQEGKSLTSWVGSLFMAIPLLAGPLASILTDRYGCRTVTICGAVVACFGFFISAFVNTIPLLFDVGESLGQSMTYRGAMLNIHRYRLRASSCPDIYRNSIITIAKSQDESVWTYFDDLGEMITSCVDYSYCLNAAYLIFAVSNFILYVFYDTVYMYLTDYAQGVGVSADDSANLISAIGILNCVGMVVMGYVGDRPWSSPMLIYNISMVLCGLSVIVMPFITDYWLLAVAAAVFGLFISANYALTSVILVELISLESFSKAYGLLLLIQGVANLIGPPLVGFIADTTGDYTMPFVISGIFIIHCGLILNLIPLIQRCRGNYRSSSTPSLADTPKNVSPTSTPNHTFKKKPAPVQV
ncbi:uncharacterized protein LOC119577689 [Penaeus monodon]|uniref:uncharacterized protein LOC119577689 n=1 Tax=Penaeus monodon TaxID=6687 RepID=UPI0018A736A5|nr:uncharacterized protein LOC119577689 [Penaeus monodon]